MLVSVVGFIDLLVKALCKSTSFTFICESVFDDHNRGFMYGVDDAD